MSVDVSPRPPLPAESESSSKVGGVEPGRRRLRSILPVVPLMLPAAIALGLLFFYPLVKILQISLTQPEVGFGNYIRMFSDGYTVEILLRTLWVSFIVAVVTMVLAFPFAYAMTICKPVTRAILFTIVLIPFWTSYIIRTYAWIGILQSNGFLDSAFDWVPGLPTDLLYTRTAVIIGFVHVFLPIMILPIYASARNLDKRYIEAAYDLGASPVSAFLRVTLPLTMPGVIAGIVLFFIPTFGSFVTPQFLGGTSDVMMGNIIDNQFGEAFNWPFGAALSIVMTLVVIVAMILFFRFADVEEIYGS